MPHREMGDTMSPKSERPRAGSFPSPSRSRAGSMSSSLGAFILSLAGEDNQSRSDVDEFIVAPIFDDEPESFYSNDDLESSPEHLQTYSNSLFNNLPNDEIIQENKEETL
jgi:hypothetical protein